jgi:hypothetical protein
MGQTKHAVCPGLRGPPSDAKALHGPLPTPTLWMAERVGFSYEGLG